MKAEDISRIQANDPKVKGLDRHGDENIDGSALCEALANNTHIKSVVLSDCNLKDDFAINMAKALMVNTTIEFLSLALNCFSDKGIMALADALRVNTTVTTFLLKGNEFSDTGARYFLRALKGYNSTLTQVELTSIFYSGRPIAVSNDEFIDKSIGEEVTQLCEQNKNGYPARFEKVKANKEELVSNTSSLCWVCGNNAPNKCARCKKVPYCGQACQKAHWKVHKTLSCMHF